MELVKLYFFYKYERVGKVKSDFYDKGGGGGWVRQKVIFDDEGGRGGNPKSDF